MMQISHNHFHESVNHYFKTIEDGNFHLFAINRQGALKISKK